MIKIAFTVLILSVFIKAVHSTEPSSNPVAYLKKVLTNIESFQTLSCTIDMKERIASSFTNEKIDLKTTIRPLKVYIYQHRPFKGRECLYVEGWNDGKVRVNPRSFPWITVNLQPWDNQMLKDHHHMVTRSGYAYFAGIIRDFLKKYSASSPPAVIYSGSKTVNNVLCHMITLTTPGYSLRKYTASKNESVLSLASKNLITYYSIVDVNPDVSATSRLDEGETILLPSDYASSMDLYIHKDKLYPLKLTVRDHKGLFEEYVYTNVVINPHYTADDFSADNPAYGF